VKVTAGVGAKRAALGIVIFTQGAS
jgi:hypothetical protein